MSDPRIDIPLQAAAILPFVLTGNYVGALAEVTKLAALIEAELVPPIDAPSLDPSDRATVDAEVDASVAKP